MSNNTEECKSVSNIREQVARIEERQKNIKEDIDEFKKEQKTHNGKIDTKIDKVLEVLTR